MTISLEKWKIPNKSCSCNTCRNMCQNPCFPSPDEAKKLMRLGYGPKLMLNGRSHPTESREIFVICPARTTCEAEENNGIGPCTFQEKGLCQLHNICKPIEGRLAVCTGREPINLRDRVVQLWDNDDARKLVRYWIKKYSVTKNLLGIVKRKPNGIPSN